MPWVPVLFLFFVLVTPNLHAQDCSQKALELDLSLASSSRGSILQKLDRMRKILSEIRVLNQKVRNPGSLPQSYYKRCLTKKHQAFAKLARGANEQMRDRPSYSALLGEYHLLGGRKKDALKAFDEAARKDPRNAEFKMKAVTLFQEVETARIKALPTEADRVRARDSYHLNAIGRLDDILKTPNASSSVVATANLYKGVILALNKRSGEAEEAFIAGLKVAPSNKLLLKNIIAFYQSTNQKHKLLPHLRKISRVDSSVKNFLAWADNAWAFEKMSDVLEAANGGLEIDESNIDLKAYKAGALFDMGRRKEAAALNRELMKKAPKNKVVLKTQSLVLEDRADKIGSDKPGEALGLYREALTLDESRSSLKEKISLLIFDYAKAKNFRPAKAIRTDFDFALNLIRDDLKRGAVSSELMRASIIMHEHSSTPGFGRELCLKEEGKVGGFDGLDLIIACAKIYKASGSSKKAQTLLDEALNDRRFEAQRKQILGAIKNVGF